LKCQFLNNVIIKVFLPQAYVTIAHRGYPALIPWKRKGTYKQNNGHQTKNNRTNNDLQNIIQKTKYPATRAPL